MVPAGIGAPRRDGLPDMLGDDRVRIGLALGGGGVRGLAHVLVLELFDELGLRPSVIAGTSMGALIGALYASGMKGRQIHELVDCHLVSHAEGRRARLKKHTELLKWIGPLRTDLKHGGMIKPDRFLRHLLGGITKSRFEDLEIPLMAVATDFWTGQEVLLESGPLMPAIRASIAIPAVFPPLHLGDRVLVDGGLVNVVPFKPLKGRCDVTIAVDVGRAPESGREDLPNVIDSVLGAFDIMQVNAFEDHLQACRPDIHVRARIAGIRILDFAKAEQVFAQAHPAVQELREGLARLGLAGKA
jgi:NTE family protein